MIEIPVKINSSVLSSLKYVRSIRSPHLFALLGENGAVSMLISTDILVNLHDTIGKEILIQLWIFVLEEKELLFAASIVDKNAIPFNDGILDYMLNCINIFPSVL